MAWYDGVRLGTRGPVTVGIVALVLAFGGFGTWAAVAPLEGAVIASGTVITLGRNKLIQHLEGGIVRELLVAEGDNVVAGQPLIVLDNTGNLALRNRIASQLMMLEAEEARAAAESDGQSEISFAPDLLTKAEEDPAVAAAIKDQQGEFQARFDRYTAEVGIIEEQISSLRQEITGLEAQQTATSQRLELLAETKADLETLLEDNLVTKSRVFDLRSQEAALTGQSGQITSAIAKAELDIASKELEKLRLVNARLEEANGILSETRGKQADLLEQLHAAEASLERTTVVAPDSGTVTTLAQLGVGSVISPGQRLMEIVPVTAGWLIEAYIRPQDIDQVHVGQSARLAFAALDQRETPQVDGTVVYVAADRAENERTGEVYYLARLTISGAAPKGFDPAKVGAGQPMEVFITTGGRTFFDYLLEPLAHTVTRAMREQ
jgi:HlyD family secretion protein